ncbi:ABC transporter substrate-binding protein [Paenibacillus filicis]|uniref:ABC transporter substrate-binding protein n=1 Tax=Paenibacillus filicis TaxID=669464 RepID=A0ABU9DV05_9BACL
MLTRWIKVCGAMLILSLVLSACGTSSPEPSEKSAGKRVITFLGESVELPAKVERIVITGAVEAMEDSILLDVQPVGAISFSGEFPPLFKPITQKAVSVGDKMKPNFEAILALKPDVILGSTKFPEEVIEKLKTIAPTILYSHVSTNWEANLRLLGELSGKEARAEEIISGYKAELKKAGGELGEKLKDKKVAVVRVRSGKMFIYPKDVYFNPVLYAELGLKAPAEILAAKAQEELSVEKFAEMNPEYVFLQFLEDENKDTPNVLKELQNNPIMKNTKAFKENKAIVNIVDPLAQGGTAYSKTEFLKAAIAELSK